MFRTQNGPEISEICKIWGHIPWVKFRQRMPPNTLYQLWKQFHVWYYFYFGLYTKICGKIVIFDVLKVLPVEISTTSKQIFLKVGLLSLQTHKKVSKNMECSLLSRSLCVASFSWIFVPNCNHVNTTFSSKWYAFGIFEIFSMHIFIADILIILNRRNFWTILVFAKNRTKISTIQDY